MLAPQPHGALVAITPTTSLRGVSAALERDERGVAWVTLAQQGWQRPVGESNLTVYRAPAPGSVWVSAGTYSGLPAGVRLWTLGGPGAEVRLAHGGVGWVALVDAAPDHRLEVEWRRGESETWQRRLLPPLHDVVSDGDVLWYA